MLKRQANLFRGLGAALRRRFSETGAVKKVTVDERVNDELQTAFDIFGSDLPDDFFDGVFSQRQDR